MSEKRTLKVRNPFLSWKAGGLKQAGEEEGGEQPGGCEAGGWERDGCVQRLRAEGLPGVGGSPCTLEQETTSFRDHD